jgi:hypothetical protein
LGAGTAAAGLPYARQDPHDDDGRERQPAGNDQRAEELLARAPRLGGPQERDAHDPADAGCEAAEQQEDERHPVRPPRPARPEFETLQRVQCDLFGLAEPVEELAHLGLAAPGTLRAGVRDVVGDLLHELPATRAWNAGERIVEAVEVLVDCGFPARGSVVDTIPAAAGLTTIRAKRGREESRALAPWQGAPREAPRGVI